MFYAFFGERKTYWTPGPHGFTVRAPVFAEGLRRTLPAKLSARTVEALLVLRVGLAHEAAFNGPPCETSARATLPRPPHSDTDVRDDRDTPLMRAGTTPVISLMLANDQAEYFSRQGSTV